MFFGNKNDGPGGDLDRITVKKFPDQYPAEKVLQAEPVQGDSKDMAVVRPLLKQTELGEELRCCRVHSMTSIRLLNKIWST